MFVSKKRIREMNKRFYNRGLMKGYALGWEMRGVEELNHSLMLNSILSQAEEIVRKSNF
jgi:hypothetical protein